MENKISNRLFLLACVLLIGMIYLISRNYLSSLLTPKQVQPFATLKPDSVTEIILKNNTASELIAKKNGHWIITKDKIDYPADTTRVSDIINAVIAVKKGDIISTNKSKHADLGIGPNSVTLKSSSNLNTVYWADSDTGMTYARINNGNDVFTTVGLGDVLRITENRDLNPHIVSNEQKVTSVDLNYNDTPLSLKKSKDNWLVNDKSAKHEQVDYFINDLKTLKGSDITQDDSIAQNNTAVMTITVTENGSTNTVNIYPKDDSTEYLSTSNSPFIYTVASTTTQSLQKDEAYFTK